MLEGGRNVDMVVVKFFALSWIAEGAIEFLRTALMPPELIVEIGQVDFYRSFLIYLHDIRNRLLINLGIAERRQPHGLAFVVIGFKAAEFRRGLVNGSKRHREKALLIAGDGVALTLAQKGRGPFARAVETQYRSALIRRNQETTGRMRLMVRHEVHFRTVGRPQAPVPVPERALLVRSPHQLVIQKRPCVGQV